MEVEGKSDSGEHLEYEELLTEVEKRAVARGLETNRPDSDDGSPRLAILFGDKPGQRPVFISEPEQATELLAVPFEEYRIVPGYEAIYNSSEDEIEVRLRPNGPFPMSLRNRPTPRQSSQDGGPGCSE
jgi:hypothetical protein